MRGRELLERRKEMHKLHSQQVPLHTIIEDFTAKYHVSPQALYKDWAHRGTWVKDIINLEDPVKVTEYVHNLELVLRDAWYKSKTSPNDSIQLGSLRLIKETCLDLVHLFLELGVKPDTITTEVFTWKEPSWLHDTATTNPTPGSTRSTAPPVDSDFLLADDDGAKPSAAPTKPSKR